MDGPELFVPLVAIISIFVGLPWLLLHYITKWKQAKTLTREDETLLDDMHDTARRLEERLITIERIMAVENPNWKSGR
jgi:phage shock protein B